MHLRALVLVAAALVASLALPQAGPRRISWGDLASLHPLLEARGLTAASFAAWVDEVARTNLRRVREGDLDHLVFYVLQSRHFTRLAPIEPALSSKALVEALGAADRDAFLQLAAGAVPVVPRSVRLRVSAFLRAIDAQDPDPRLSYFRGLVGITYPDRPARAEAIAREYLRVMRFLYHKEFIAQRSAGPEEAVARLYRTRGLSTDTSVEAGYLVYQALGILRSLDPTRSVRRVLIVGPGIDLAPRTGLRDDEPLVSYQPWTVIDALLDLGLSRLDDLQVVGADINPRVVEHLERCRLSPPALALTGSLRESATLTFSGGYRDYAARVGATIGGGAGLPAATAARHGQAGKQLVLVRPDVVRTLRAQTLDIVTERLQDDRFDLVVATNVLAYLDDRELILAMSNIAGMLAPGGTLLHNEGRPLLHEVGQALDLPLIQSRHAAIATVRGAPGPLGDSVWLHAKR
jgi:hypothetical protein